MAKIIINKVNKLISTTANTILDLNVNIMSENDTINKDIVFFADVEKSTTFDKDLKYNENCLSASIDNNEGQLIHNMYADSDSFFKSAIYRLSKTYRKNNTYDYLNIITHKLSSELTNMVKVENYVYAMEEKTSYGRYTISDDIYSWISCSNGSIIPPNNRIATVIYDKTYIKTQLLDNKPIDSQKAISVVFDDIEYNMIYEIPGNVYNDYQSGSLAANTFKAKNQYSCTYDMMHDDDHKLRNARNYTGIGSCGKLVFLRYNDNVSYESSTPTTDDLLDVLTYEKVEIIDLVNRFKKLNGHSTNLYSILIETDLVNPNEYLTELSDILYITLEILSNVRLIAEKLVPAQALLLSVFVQSY